MKYQRAIITILLFFCFSIVAISNSKNDSSIILKQNKYNSDLDVDFNALNSFNNEELELQAFLSYLNNDFHEAAKSYLKIIEHNIDDANSLYQLACCFAMMGNSEFACNFLIMAINSGYNDFMQIKNEKRFKPIENNSDFINTMNEVLSYGKKFGETFYVEANVLIKCKLIFPRNYDPAKYYKLLVGLHGFGGNAENFSLIWDRLDLDDIIYVVPEAPYLISGFGKSKYQYSWGIRGTDDELWKKSDPEVMNYIINVVDQMKKNYKIDRSYLLGFSQGAAYAYAYATGIKNTDKIDAVIAFGGNLPDPNKYPWFLSDEELFAGNKLKIFIAHGKYDEAISYKKSVEARKKLAKLNYDVELFIFEGKHLVDEKTTIEALKWLDGALNK